MTAKKLPQGRRLSGRTQARSLAEQIADIVASDIVHGIYAPGDKVVETELAERLNISRGPVRDALTLLESNMLVTSKPRSYTMVNRLTVTELEHLFTYREHVLGIASQYAAMNRTEEDLLNLAEVFERRKDSIKKQPSSLASNAYSANQVWDAIIDASHSHVVRQGCLHFVGSNIWLAAVQDKIPGSAAPKFQASRIKLWDSLYASIEEGQKDAAFLAGSKLVRNHWEFLKKVFGEFFPKV